MTTRFGPTIALGALLALAPGAAGAQVVPAPGFAVHSIPTPGTVQGAVVRRGNAILVGQGGFGPGLQEIIRLEGTLATPIGTGFGSLGGFDLDGSGTLWAVDNCFTGDFGCAASVTGDTLYAIPDALTRAAPLAATAAEVLPSGSIPFPFDTLVVPGAVLVSDGAGPGAGTVVQVVGGVASTFATGFDFTAGLALDGGSVYVGNSDAFFVGSVSELDLSGTPLGTLVGGLSGAFGLALDNAGDVLVAGGFTGDFSSSTVVAVDGLGATSERAHGFGFSTELFHDAARDQTLVLDFGVSEITVICADADADGICDADCAGPAAVSKAKLKLTRTDTPPGDDGLNFSGEMQIPAVPSYDPVADGVILTIDDADARVVADVSIPGGAFDNLIKEGWKANKAGTSWKFKSKTGVAGIRTVVVKQNKKDPTRVKFKVVGKNGGFGAAGAALPLRAVFSVAPAGQCGAVDFADAGLLCVDTGKIVICR